MIEKRSVRCSPVPAFLLSWFLVWPTEAHTPTHTEKAHAHTEHPRTQNAHAQPHRKHTHTPTQNRSRPTELHNAHRTHTHRPTATDQCPLSSHDLARLSRLLSSLSADSLAFLAFQTIFFAGAGRPRGSGEVPSQESIFGTSVFVGCVFSAIVWTWKQLRRWMLWLGVPDFTHQMRKQKLTAP